QAKVQLRVPGHQASARAVVAVDGQRGRAAQARRGAVWRGPAVGQGRAAGARADQPPVPAALAVQHQGPGGQERGGQQV
ncbi:hypothetical protein IWQ56_003562, partial [Coemansia nantahalensis]